MDAEVRFSDAARLFAENWQVVEDMRKNFHREIQDFLRSVRESVEKNLGRDVMERRTAGTFLYWCLAPEGMKLDWPKKAQACCRLDQPGIIVAQEVVVHVFSNTKDREKKEAVRSLRSHPDIVARARDPKDRWAEFEIVLPCPAGTPVEDIARPIADLLVLLEPF
jgi:hypothetical protein